MGGKAILLPDLVVGLGCLIGLIFWEGTGFSGGRDPFAFPPGVQKGIGGPKAGKAGQTAPAFRVTTILISGPNRVAAVDGVLMRKGDELKGYRVEAIEDKRVVLVRGKEKMVLHIESGDRYSFKKTDHDRRLLGASQ